MKGPCVWEGSGPPGGPREDLEGGLFLLFLLGASRGSSVDLVTRDPALRGADQAGGRILYGLELTVSPRAVPIADPVGGLAHRGGQQVGVGRHEIGQRAGLQLDGPLHVDVEVAQALAPAGLGGEASASIRAPHAGPALPGLVDRGPARRTARFGGLLVLVGVGCGFGVGGVAHPLNFVPTKEAVNGAHPIETVLSCSKRVPLGYVLT